MTYIVRPVDVVHWEVGGVVSVDLHNHHERRGATRLTDGRGGRGGDCGLEIPRRAVSELDQGVVEQIATEPRGQLLHYTLASIEPVFRTAPRKLCMFGTEEFWVERKP